MKNLGITLLLSLLFASIVSGQGNPGQNFTGANHPDYLYPILVREQVKGYFFCYPYQINAKGEREFKVDVFDSGFQPTNEFVVSFLSNLDILDVSCNGERFLFVLYRLEKTSVYFQMTDIKGQVLFNEMQDIPYGTINKSAMQNSIHPIDDKGFVFRRPLPGNLHVFECINNQGKIEWQTGKTDTAEVRSLEAALDLIYIDSAIMALQVEYKDARKKSENDVSEGLIRIADVVTGAQICDIDIDLEGVVFVPYYFQMTAHGIEVFGQCFEEKGSTGNYYYTKTLGLLRMLFDLQGNKLDEKYVTWDQGLKPVLGHDFLGEGTKAKYPQVHAIYKMPNGQYYAVGELLSAYVDYEGARIASFDYRAYLLMTLRPDFTIDTAALIQVEGAVPGPRKWKYNNFNGLGHYLSKANFVEYAYSFTDAASGSFGCIFTNGMKANKKSKKSYHFDVVGLNREGKFYRNSIPAAHALSSIFMLPSKYGCVAYYQVIQTSDVFYYTLQLQKLDF